VYNIECKNKGISITEGAGYTGGLFKGGDLGAETVGKLFVNLNNKEKRTVQ
jgi:hypothetical protein